MRDLSLRASLAMFIVVGGAFAALAFAMGAGSLYGIGVDLRWQLIDSGHIERHALTTKSSRFRVPERSRIVMVPGEKLEIDYAFEGKSGRASVAVRGYGWVFFLGPFDHSASAWRIPPAGRGTLTAPARRAGFHEIRMFLHDAVGTLEADGRVADARPLGRLIRGARFAFFVLVGLVVVLVVFELGRRLVGAAT